MIRTWPRPDELLVKTLGPCTLPSPLGLEGRGPGHYTSDEARVLLNAERPSVYGASELSFEKAGARKTIYFDPAHTRAGIVTCGGLCPGVNHVIRSAVLELRHRYRVRDVIGFRYGFSGMVEKHGHAPMSLGLDEVRMIHRQGGSRLGTSRGAEDVGAMVDTLQRLDLQVLLTIGGDGTLRGAHAITREIERRGANIAVVGIPKTIDNDVSWIDRTFGFETAVQIAKDAVDAAHTEALAAENGVGLVRLMGRDSGFIAAAATLASLDANYCIVPEVPVILGGETGFLAALEARLAARKHAVIVVGEGCSHLFPEAVGERDASGNLRYASEAGDVGPRLRDAIIAHFKARNLPLTLKYIDPSYLIRSVPANAGDAIFCDGLARAAVHAAMAGKTDMVVGHWNGAATHLPIPLATAERKVIDPEGPMWLAVLETTGQPARMGMQS